jgi:hypothetical protein
MPYSVRFIPSDALPHPLDENIDVEVVFDDSIRFVATFFTLENVRGLFRRNQVTGECRGGLYFWASDMILVERLTLEAVKETVEDLLLTGEFESAFDGPYPVDPSESSSSTDGGIG